jgi:RNA polymerase sigma-70 factor (ECF subfamily)
MDAKGVFEILVREHAGMLRVYLRSVVHDAAAVDDLFQETMLTAWRLIDRFDSSRPFGPWLRGIAGKLVLAWRRQQAAGPRLCDAAALEQLDLRLSEVQRLPGDTLDEKLEALRRCVAALPDHYQATIDGRFRQQLTPVELASRLQLNLETVKKRLQRARTLLLDCMIGKLAALEAEA